MHDEHVVSVLYVRDHLPLQQGLSLNSEVYFN